MKALEMLYPELFKAFEAVRWTIESDVPWDEFDASSYPANRRSLSR
jgi:hypothetical protein